MDSVSRALKEIRREDFLPAEVADNFALDAPLPIGFGQTNSQPTTVKMMLEWLEVEPGAKILDVGSGSGWTTAILSRLTGPKGKIYAVEIIPELVDFGRANCRHLGISNARFYLAGKQLGLPYYAPYDRILVSAAARQLPEKLIDQLAPGGKMVVPVRNDILEIEKDDNGQIDTIVHSGFAFVPLINSGRHAAGFNIK